MQYHPTLIELYGLASAPPPARHLALPTAATGVPLRTRMLVSAHNVMHRLLALPLESAAPVRSH